tara:strand:+ start:877 stop:1014 length:138 start_codon:yes stop_codon:yes gene_type:complete
MDLWSLIEIEKVLQNKTLKEFKSWLDNEFKKEEKKMAEFQKEERI